MNLIFSEVICTAGQIHSIYVHCPQVQLPWQNFTNTKVDCLTSYETVFSAGTPGRATQDGISICLILLLKIRTARTPVFNKWPKNCVQLIVAHAISSYSESPQYIQLLQAGTHTTFFVSTAPIIKKPWAHDLGSSALQYRKIIDR